MNPPEEKPPIAWQEPLLDVADAILAQKWIVFSIILIGLSLGVYRLSKMPSIYTASAVAVLLPREKATLDASIDTSSLETSDDRAGKSGAGSLMLPPNPSLYTTIILSRAVLTEIATKYNHRFDGEISSRDRSVEVVRRLRGMIKASTTEEGMITLTVSSETAELSADIANELFAQCEKASKAIERQLLIRQAGHLDKALKISTERLRQTEEHLSKFTSNLGLVNAELQASSQFTVLRELDLKKDRLEAELEALRLSHTDITPEVQNVLARLAAIKRQQIDSQDNFIGNLGTKDFGKLSVGYHSLKQKIRFERDMVSTLSTKSDIYRLRAEQPIGNLAIIRHANVPTRPSGPSKKMELGLSLGLSIVIAFGFAIGMQQLGILNQNPTLHARLERILKQIHPRLKFRQP
jgi:uncharacterized protein involved in exopolysaccharide biosynthesis